MRRYRLPLVVMACVWAAAFQSLYVVARLPGEHCFMLNTWKTGCVIYALNEMYASDVLYTDNEPRTISTSDPWRVSGHITKFAVMKHTVAGYCVKNRRVPNSRQGYFLLNTDDLRCNYGMTYPQYRAILREMKLPEPRLISGALRPYQLWLGWLSLPK